MSALRRLSHDLRYLLLNSSKQTFEPLSVGCSRGLWAGQTYLRPDTSPNYQMTSKCNFHTSIVNRDLEAGLRAVGAGCSMIGALGAGIGIGEIYGNLVAAVARNPSTKDQLFILALMGTAFCEAIALFGFLVSVLILFT